MSGDFKTSGGTIIPTTKVPFGADFKHIQHTALDPDNNSHCIRVDRDGYVLARVIPDDPAATTELITALYNAVNHLLKREDSYPEVKLGYVPGPARLRRQADEMEEHERQKALAYKARIAAKTYLEEHGAK